MYVGTHIIYLVANTRYVHTLKGFEGDVQAFAACGSMPLASRAPRRKEEKSWTAVCDWDGSTMMLHDECHCSGCSTIHY
jgi:hypothetical protein